MNNLKGKKQLTRSVLSDASIDAIWAVLIDTQSLPLWAPAVIQLEPGTTGKGEVVGAIRVCKVKLGKRTGVITERITDFKSKSHITYAVESDSLGMTKMFADYAFRLSLKAMDNQQTQITCETFYTPKNMLFSLFNLVMKPHFKKTVDGILHGLAKFSLH